MKESEEVSQGIEIFIEGLNEFMRNPPLKDYEVQTIGKNKDGIEINYSQYINFIKKVWNEASTAVGINANNEGISIRINKFTKSSVTFKIFIYNKNFSKEDLLKHSRSSDFKKITKNIKKDNDEEITVNFLDTGYGKSDIPNFYFEDSGTEKETLYAKVNGKLLKATEAAESLVALYFNDLKGKVDNFENFNNKDLFTPQNVPLGSENIANNEVKEAIKVICADKKWNLSCKANALGILKFLNQSKVNKEMFTAKHPSWIDKREKDIVINEYVDPSDIFLVKEGDKNFDTDYKEKCKDEFSASNPRTLGVSLKKLKLLTDQSVEQDKPSEKIFKTPNFFLTGWKMKTSPKVIYKKNPTERDLKSKNYFVSEVSIKVSNSRDSESGESGKTMYFNCIVNGEDELLFTIRKNGGKNFVLESAGSEGTESQGGKCSKLIDFVIEDQYFKDSLMTAIKKFNLAQEEAKKLAKGEEGSLSIVETEIDNINDVLQRINALQGFKLSEESVKRAAIAFAFAKKLPFFSGDRSVDDLVIEAFSKLGYNGEVYNKKAKAPIFLGFGKDAYYSGN